MGKKDKKLTKDQKAIRKAEKKEKQMTKTERNEKKKLLKLRQQEEEEEDIELLIAKFKKMDEQKTAVEEIALEKNFWPSPRSHASIVVAPNGDFIVFGGEYFDGRTTFVYNDLFRYSIAKGEWKQISSPNTPPPRCSHQAVIFKKFMYVFGGEFTSPSQNQFYHYRDFWRFNLETNKWEDLSKEWKSGGPTARSGHRMVLWKNKLIIFGGFYDALTTTKYFNDLYFVDLDTHKCTKVVYKPTDLIPKPRSGSALGVYENTLFLYGGYSKEKVKQTQYGEPQGIVHNDMYQMNLMNGVLSWEKIKKSGIPPNPSRSGFTTVVHSKKMYFFGGVKDEDDNLEKSTFFNDLFAFHMDTKRWFLITLKGVSDKKKKKKKPKKKPAASKKEEEKGQEDRGGSEDDLEKNENEEDLPSDEEKDIKQEKNENKKEENENKKEENENKKEKNENKKEENENKKEKNEKKKEENENKKEKENQKAENEKEDKNKNQVPKKEDKNKNEEDPKNDSDKPKVHLPHPRMNGMMAVSNNYLYLFGGSYETDRREVTLDDLHSLNTNSLDTWNILMEARPQEWLGSDSENDSDDSEDDDSEDDLLDENEEDPTKSIEKKAENIKQKKGKLEALKFELSEQAKDGKPVSEPHELLKDFWKRTERFWKTEAFRLHPEERDEKALKVWAFPLCEERFKQLEPLMKRFEELELENQTPAKPHDKKKAPKSGSKKKN